MNDITNPSRPQRAVAWLRTHRPAAIAIAAAVVIVAGGGTVAGTTMTKQHAVDEWTSTRAKLTATTKTAATVQDRYEAARKQTQATATLAKDLVDVRGGAMDEKLWKALNTARTAASKALETEPVVEFVSVAKPSTTDRESYELAASVGRKALTVNTARVDTIKTSTKSLEQTRTAVLEAGGKIAAAVAKDEEYRKGKYPDATQQTKDAVHRAAGTAVRAQQQHPHEDLVLTSARNYLKAVHALKKSNAEQAAAKKAALDAQAAAAAAAAQSSSSAGVAAGGTTGPGRSSGGWSPAAGGSSASRGSNGGSAPSTGGGPSAGAGGSSGAGAPAPSTGAGGSAGSGGSSGGGATVRPPQYALMHSTRVASCNPGEYTYSFGPNIGSMPSRYLSVSTSWNGSDWVYSGTTCGS